MKTCEKRINRICVNSARLFPCPPLSGANRGGKERTVTGVCLSPAACTAHVRRHGSVCATRAGWAACATKVGVIQQRSG